jgi:hypothetical protein
MTKYDRFKGKYKNDMTPIHQQAILRTKLSPKNGVWSYSGMTVPVKKIDLDLRVSANGDSTSYFSCGCPHHLRVRVNQALSRPEIVGLALRLWVLVLACQHNVYWRVHPLHVGHFVVPILNDAFQSALGDLKTNTVFDMTTGTLDLEVPFPPIV